jgi:hypothetical protein
MRKLLVVSFFVCLTGICLAGELNPSGRYLRDGSWQPRNLHAALPAPTPGMPAQESEPDNRNHITSINWEPEIRISHTPPITSCFYSGIIEWPNGFIHSLTCNYATELHYIRSTDGGISWEHRAIVGQVGGDFDLFEYQNYIILPFGGSVFHCTISSDSGSSWSDWGHIYIPGVNNSTAIANACLFTVLNTDVHLIDCFQSSNQGQNWYYHSTPFRGDVYAMELTGTISAIHLVLERIRQEVYYQRYAFDSQTWGDTIPISDGAGNNSINPNIISWNDTNLVAEWLDYKYSNYPWTGDIFIRRSTDDGLTWMPEQQLTFNHLTFLDHDRNLFARNDSLYIVYEEIVLDGQTNTEEVFFNLSTDGGATWGEPLRLTNAPYRSIYPSINVFENHINVVFCDARDDTLNGNHNSLYFMKGTISGTDNIHNNQVINHDPIEIGAFPNPFNSATTITLTGEEQAEIGIYDITGRLIAALHTLGGQALWDASVYSSGLYFARVIGEKAGTIKLVLVK